MESNQKEIISRHQRGDSERNIANDMGVTRHFVRKVIEGGRMSADIVPLEPKTSSKAAAMTIADAFERSSRRISRDSERNPSRLFGRIPMLLADDQTTGDYRYEWMDSKLLRNTPVSDIIEIAIASSPEVSRAVWDFLRAAVPGWECRVIDPRTEGEHPEGQKIVNEFRKRIALYHGGEEVLYTRMFTSILVRGSLLSEIYFEKDSKTPVDIAIPDPKTLRYREIDDPIRGVRWQVGQIQDGVFVPLEGETIRYVAHDPMPGKPYARSPLGSAVFPAIFLLGIFQDMRRVIANQGWPRVDISIDVEGIQEMLAEALNDDNIAENGEVIANVLASITSQVEQAVGSLNPGDWYVHSSIVKVNDAVGTMDVNSIGEVTSIIESLERVAVKALKTMPILQGISDAASEANANRQWEMWAASVKALQHLVENSLQAHYNTVLQANGIDAHCIFRFAEIRAAEELRDAQTLMMKLDNAIKAEGAGYMEADEASMYVTGHAIPDSIKSEREPLLNSLADNDDMTQWSKLDTDGGEGDNENENSRSMQVYTREQEMLPIVPEDVTITILDALAATNEFDEMMSEYAGLLNAEIE